MRFLVKLIILAIICFVIYHFFGPQIDAYFHQAKTKVTEVFHPAHQGKDDNSDQDRKYYPIEKRTQ